VGIVVCLVMLLGLVVLRPSPWDKDHRVELHPKFVLVVVTLLAVIGSWNVIYAIFKIHGFWFFMSLLSGVTMVFAAILITLGDYSSNEPSISRNLIIAVLALSFLVYAVTLIQLNLGFAILR